MHAQAMQDAVSFEINEVEPKNAENAAKIPKKLVKPDFNL